jgi:hypothetical protein
MDEEKTLYGIASSYKDAADRVRAELFSFMISGTSSMKKDDWLKKQYAERKELEDRVAEKLKAKDIEDDVKTAYEKLKVPLPDVKAQVSAIAQSAMGAHLLVLAAVASSSARMTDSVMKSFSKDPMGVKTTKGTLNYDTYLDASVEKDYQIKNLEKIQSTEHKLWRCNTFSDSARDHAAYQGKVYVLSKYRNEYPDLITVEEITAPPVRLTTRWNCRHKLYPVDDIKSEPMLKRRDVDKSNALLTKQRTLERFVRGKNGEVQMLVSLYQETKDKTNLDKALTLFSKRNKALLELKKITSENDFLKRDFRRETQGFSGKTSVNEIKTIERNADPTLEPDEELFDKLVNLKAKGQQESFDQSVYQTMYLAGKRNSPEKGLYEMDSASVNKSIQEEMDKYTANENTFFFDTDADFKFSGKKPKGDPSHTSYNSYTGKVSSEYWYTEEGVYRRSDHWGQGVASCNWNLKDNPESKTKESSGGLEFYSKKLVGFAPWSSFKRNKTRFITLVDEKEQTERHYLLSFKNLVGKDYVSIGGKEYITHFPMYSVNSKSDVEDYLKDTETGKPEFDNSI